jgi:hypothetical protein
MASRAGNAAHLRTRGITLLELAVAACVLAVVFAVLLGRLRYYQEMAEKSAVELTVQSMQNGLQMRAAELIMRGDRKGLRALQGGNPVLFLEQPPDGYAGELADADPQLPGGSWYFDLTRHELVYVPEIKAHLSVDGVPEDRIRLRFQARIDAENGSVAAGQTSPPAPHLYLATPYTWFKNPV